MKKLLALTLALALMLSLGGCAKTYDDPEELLNAYLTAVNDEDYEAIWDMLPEEIQDYAIEEDIIDDKEDGIKFIKKATKDYSWLKKWTAADSKGFTVDIMEEHVADEEGIEDALDYFDEIGLDLEITGTVYYECDLETDDEEIISFDFWLIEIDGNWYIASVAGDDEAFVY